MKGLFWLEDLWDFWGIYKDSKPVFVNKKKPLKLDIYINVVVSG